MTEALVNKMQGIFLDFLTLGFQLELLEIISYLFVCLTCSWILGAQAWAKETRNHSVFQCVQLPGTLTESTDVHGLSPELLNQNLRGEVKTNWLFFFF